MENEMKSINSIKLTNSNSPRNPGQGSLNVTKNISTSSFQSEGSMRSNHVRTF
jgi:hypothetical protein